MVAHLPHIPIVLWVPASEKQKKTGHIGLTIGAGKDVPQLGMP